ncbi:MAG: tRNA (guanosine(37)-N1)-methyltransferase TrmD [candidate division Zixibacteria bacterium]|nr:tRNA (guanosine(37)-N1)-methyltransferase TrmD [candidate division Zixibacteria bacterium]
MRFEIVTLFPDYFELSLRQSLIGKAIDKKLFDIRITNLRDFATDKHRTTDASPYGGGGGMVMMLEPMDRCLESLGYQRTTDGGQIRENDRIILTSAAGKVFRQQLAVEYSLAERMTIICGHYLGVDERLLELYPIEEVSIGDFVLSGGEPAAAVMIDAVARLIPGVLGNFESAIDDSHMETSTGSPCYARPAEYAGLKVPEALLSGDHARIAEHRKMEALTKCQRNRPDLIEKIKKSEQD